MRFTNLEFGNVEEALRVSAESHPYLFGKWFGGDPSKIPAGARVAFEDPETGVLTTTHYQSRRDIVHVAPGTAFAVMKQQPIIIVRTVTTELTNAIGSEDTNRGKPVLKIQGFGWKPEGVIGQLQVQDVGNPQDQWFVFPGDMDAGCIPWPDPEERTRRFPQIPADVTIYTKAKVQAALQLPLGTIVGSEEGSYPIEEGDLFVMNKPDDDKRRGDGQRWPKGNVQLNVRGVKSFDIE